MLLLMSFPEILTEVSHNEKKVKKKKILDPDQHQELMGSILG